MKYFYVGILILCLLFCACYFSTTQISSRSGEMIGGLEQALTSSRLDNEMQRDRQVKHVASLWDHNRVFFSTLISHNIIHEVSLDLQQLHYADGSEFDRICSRILTRLRAIKELDRPTIGNIL